MRTLALDPSTSATGYALFDSKQLIESGVIRAKASDGLRDRIVEIYSSLNVVARKNELMKNAVMIVESPWKITGHSAASAAAMNNLIGALMIFAWDWKMELDFCQVAKWRSVVGIRPGTPRDKAKRLARQVVNLFYEKSVSDDEADAICIGHWFVNRNYGVEK